MVYRSCVVTHDLGDHFVGKWNGQIQIPTSHCNLAICVNQKTTHSKVQKLVLEISHIRSAQMGVQWWAQTTAAGPHWIPPQAENKPCQSHTAFPFNDKALSIGSILGWSGSIQTMSLSQHAPPDKWAMIKGETGKRPTYIQRFFVCFFVSLSFFLSNVSDKWKPATMIMLECKSTYHTRMASEWPPAIHHTHLNKPIAPPSVEIGA